MKIISKNITFCEECCNWKGTAEEYYNGVVPVHCYCSLIGSQEKGTRSPSMICPRGDKLWWTPISEYIGSDGRWYHVASFAGPSLNIKSKTENILIDSL